MSKYTVCKSDAEIDAARNICADCEDEGKTQFSGMSYEQGVLAGIRWVLEGVDYPLE